MEAKGPFDGTIVSISTRSRIPILDDGKQANFVEYELLLSKGADEVERSVWFTYKQANEIDSKLKKLKQFKKFEFPAFPPRAFFRSETEVEFIESRRLGLEAYFKRVVPSCGGMGCEELDALLDGAEAKFDFSCPSRCVEKVGVIFHQCDLFSRMVHAPTVSIGDEEIWIGLICDGLFEGLAFLVKLKTNVDQLVGLEAKLGVLELNHGRTQVMFETISSNLESLRRVIEVEGLPADTKAYFERIEKEARKGLTWARHIEAQLLSTLDSSVNTAEAAAAAAAVLEEEEETPGRIEDVEYERMPTEETASNTISLSSAQLNRSHDNSNNEKEKEEAFMQANAPEALSSLAACMERADELVLDMATCQSAVRQSALLQSKKDLVEQMTRLRDRDGPENAAAWNRALAHVQDTLVCATSVHDSIARLEGQLYELIDRRGRLSSKSDRAECSSVRRGVIALRRLLRQVKEGEFKSSSVDEFSDPAMRADFNRITDVQENAAQLQLDLENTFEFDTNMEDMVVDKLKQRVVETATKEHEQADQDMFEL